MKIVCGNIQIEFDEATGKFKYIIAELPQDHPEFLRFNEFIKEDLRKRTEQTRKPGWKTASETFKAAYGTYTDPATVLGVCHECNQPLSRHLHGKCPTIIDAVATDIEDDKPRLLSGKE